MSKLINQTLIRIALPEFDELRTLLFRRYPQDECVTFARFGWRESPSGLVCTLVDLVPPGPGDIDDSVGNVRLLSPYSLRMALAAEQHSLAVGVIHSHPRNYWPLPSHIDDDMDAYYSDYFSSFAMERPYLSLIFSEMGSAIAGSGRIWHKGEWHRVTRFAVERTPVQTLTSFDSAIKGQKSCERVKRLTDAFGAEAAQRLRAATVAVIGAGGTGSAAIEVLARAGIGRLIVVDPEPIETSNLERIHGSVPKDAQSACLKVEIAKRHVKSIDPHIVFEGIVGRLPQNCILDRVIHADVVLGCTDKGYGRIALSELAWRFLVPAIDTGVSLDGADGRVTAQVLQLVTFRGGEPCALCSRMTNAVHVSQELMPREEREQRIRAAQEARARGEDPNPYWIDIPQLNTVGYLTTMVGSMAAGYAIGWITCRFDAPFSRLQANLVAELLDTTDSRHSANPSCACQLHKGWSNQGEIWSHISAPSHWPKPVDV